VRWIIAAVKFLVTNNCNLHAATALELRQNWMFEFDWESSPTSIDHSYAVSVSRDEAERSQQRPHDRILSATLTVQRWSVNRPFVGTVAASLSATSLISDQRRSEDQRCRPACFCSDHTTIDDVQPAHGRELL